MDNKFGLFVHWGIYSLGAFHEQEQWKKNIPIKEYEKYMHEFNPTEYDPEEWVLLAKNAGMKYICFTTKHHDGFCMWDTKYTDFNIMNTPYGKDVLKMLADACKKHGMLLSLYYSCPDWHHENAYNVISNHQVPSAENRATADSVRYREYVKNQVRELLTNYGEIYTFFWDIPPKIRDESINELIRSLQPHILINNRGYDEGDFSTPEREVPRGKRFATMTEACQSVGEQSWGYRADEDYYSVRYLMSSIDRVMAMNGSYLLNVGPMANGKICEKAKQMVARIGDWYNRMEGVLENTDPDTLELQFKNDTGKYICTWKNQKTYFHFYNGLNSSAITFKGLASVPAKARLMNSGKELRLRFDMLPVGGCDPLGHACVPQVSIADIPVDDYPGEPLVIEVEW